MSLVMCDSYSARPVMSRAGDILASDDLNKIVLADALS